METIVRFNNVTFEYREDKPLLDEASFSIKNGVKIALMGQNGAGKSTLFKLITEQLKPTHGQIAVSRGVTIATSHQVVDPADYELTVEQYFGRCINVELHELRSRLAKVLTIVKLHAPGDKKVGAFSGGQQARLLLAAALIQDPDLLLLDEPTNNLDPEGIAHLMEFLMEYKKTCLVISHDADFLNSFTQGVLYLDTFTHKVDYFPGNYYDVVEDIAARIEKERQQNARMEKGIIENKEKANFFAHKGGKMRLVAKKMREKAAEMEENKVDIRREDRTIPPFTIETQENMYDTILHITGYNVVIDHKPQPRTANIRLERREHLQVVGPNGVGKTTLIDSIARQTSEGAAIARGIRIGYYRQDFSTLNFEETVYKSLEHAAEESGVEVNETLIRSTAARFLLTKDQVYSKIGNLSEGQKGLLSFARLVLLKPGLLILDEPTNHINFRHLPIIAQALDKFEGAMVLVSHLPEFVWQIRIDKTLELE